MTGHEWILVLSVAMLVRTQADTGVSGYTLPKPSLTLNTTVDVVKLHCETPSEAHHWDVVYDLKLLWSQGSSESNNEFLVNWTSAIPGDPPHHKLPRLAKMSFLGSFKNKDISLSIWMPLTSSVVFYCTMQYLLTGSELSTLQRKIAVSHPFNSHEINQFSVEYIPAHLVNVTWEMGVGLFTKASVSRIDFDRDGAEITAPLPLFVTNGKQNMTYEDEGFLLADLDTVTRGNGRNYTLTVFLRRHKCVQCSYTCYVANKYCYGSMAKYCDCQWKELDTNASRNTCSGEGSINTSLSCVADSGKYLTLIVGFVVSLAFLVSIIIVVLCRKKIKRYCSSLCHRETSEADNGSGHFDSNSDTGDVNVHVRDPRSQIPKETEV